MKEIWKDIEGWEGLYRVSNLGNIYSVVSNMVRKANRNNSGYLCVTLKSKGRKTQTITVHRAVAVAFVENPNPEIFTEACHINEIATDNRAVNLTWGDHKTNCNAPERRKRLSKALSGEQMEGKHPRAKKVLCVELDMVFDSVSQAQRYLKSQCHISQCCLGKIETAGGYHWKYVN